MDNITTDFWDVLLWSFWFFIWIAALIVWFRCIVDLFRPIALAVGRRLPGRFCSSSCHGSAP